MSTADSSTGRSNLTYLVNRGVVAAQPRPCPTTLAASASTAKNPVSTLAGFFAPAPAPASASTLSAGVIAGIVLSVSALLVGGVVGGFFLRSRMISGPAFTKVDTPATYVTISDGSTIGGKRSVTVQ